jgi:hypothetical protein
MLVRDGTARSGARRNGRGRYSALAGSSSPRVEEAVAREVRESGVLVDDVRYHRRSRGCSRPRCSAPRPLDGRRARGGRRRLRGRRWFTRDEVASGAMLLPPPRSHRPALIEDWLHSG